ncbi:MAG: restriction endonuclease subunit M [Bacteroidales bacterium]|nr:restriction endonuclease subunit M [Bacteroidales bacterium]
MADWKETVEKLLNSRQNKVAQISIANKTVDYSEKIKNNRDLKSLTGDEEIVRAFLIDRLVNELGYNPIHIETEKEYPSQKGHTKLDPRIDILLKDDKGNPFFFIEAKAPSQYEIGKNDIEGQLFALAKDEEEQYKTKVKYLVYYTADFQNNRMVDRALIIDFCKYRSYIDWENDGFPSFASELPPGYGKPQKPRLIKGGAHDLRMDISKEDIESLSRNLHNVLWGGGGTTDSEIFYSLVNIILSKIQDEYEKEDGKEYDFQVHQYGDTIESPDELFDRINELYKRALKEQLNVTEQKKIDDDKIINRNKFPLNKLVYAVQELETYSFLDGRNAMNGKDILGNFFEGITRDGFKQTKGQFFTPVNIVNFMLYALQLDKLALDKLNNNRELPLIIDPSLGSGTFLVEAMKLITKELKYKQRSEIKSSNQVKQRFEELFTPDNNENKWARMYLYGSENNFDLGTASKVNMILHGDGSTNIFVQDGLLPFRYYKRGDVGARNYLEFANEETIYHNKDVNGSFDVVISNPPFSVDLDIQTQREIKHSFLFGDNKNSENLFIERYYQLLKEGGRLGVVLPENVYDTVDSKYIRLFLFKYFKIKAVVSLPQLTFEPYTSTKTSLLFAQKKTKQEVEKWNSLWNKYGNEWGKLKTRVSRYYNFFVKNEKISKKYAWVKELTSDVNQLLEVEDGKAIELINNNDKTVILNNIKHLLKDYITPDDENMEIKMLLEKYDSEIEELCKYDNETRVFGYYNTWWVFGEVAKEMNYDIFMAEAENVGYKRTKRGERSMPNELFDIEYAPQKMDTKMIINEYAKEIAKQNEHLTTSENELKKIIEKESPTKTEQKEKKRLENIVREKMLKIAQLTEDKTTIERVFEKYYDNNGYLKADYYERTDKNLLSIFKTGLLKKYASNDILLRHNEQITILDTIRKEVIWE